MLQAVPLHPAALLSRAGLILIAATSLTGACGDDHGHHPDAIPTDAVCAPGSTLSYEDFGKPFMEKYCTRCHHSELNGSERQGAPLYHDFDTLDGILVVANHVDWYAAAGPSSTNEIMPPNGELPTLQERTNLGEWLVCELEKI